jgi:4-amino-4-deoxy-L-arabinose transferase-like glycosyltransferase
MDMQRDTPMDFLESRRADRQLGISIEFLAYTAILVIGLVLRLAELDSTPLMASETHNALAAWRVIMPNAAGTPLISNSPLLFALQSISFTLFGASEVSARIVTVIGGLLLIASPILFRPLIGKTHAFLMSLLLTFSPVLLIASRASSPDVWASLLAVLSLWAFLQAGRTMQNRYAVMAVVLFGSLLFLSGTGGLVVGLILVLAGIIAGLWLRRGALLESIDQTPGSAFAVIRKSLSLALPLALLVVLAVSTGFMLYPNGLSSIGEAVGGALRAVLQPQGISGYAALISLFYEPMLWVFAVVSLIIRRERLGTLDIFLLAWVVLGVIATLLFADGSPDHALWLTVPLAALSINALAEMLAPDSGLVYQAAPRWARWVIAASSIGVLAVFSVSFQALARSMIQTPNGDLKVISPPADSVILVLVSVMFLFIGYFMFASLWGNRTAWQGIGLGFVIFGAVTSLGAGWSASVTNAQNPAVFWHTEATNSSTILLRKTLFEVADRISRGFPSMPVMVMAPQDGVVAWVLRDFNNAKYINDISDAENAEVVLLPRNIESPNLGAAYLGQNFIVSRSWTLSTMNPIDLPAWWTQGQARTPWTGQDEIVLWLRQDVYQGLNQLQASG